METKDRIDEYNEELEDLFYEQELLETEIRVLGETEQVRSRLSQTSKKIKEVISWIHYLEDYESK